MRVTLDTMVLFSGLQGRGASYAILQAMLAGSFEAAITVALFLEYEDVLTRPEILQQLHGMTQTDVLEFLEDFAVQAYQAHPVYFQQRPALPHDADDERVVECVLQSQSKYLVTMNIRHFQTAARHFGFGLLSPPKFIQHVRSN